MNPALDRLARQALREAPNDDRAVAVLGQKLRAGGLTGALADHYRGSRPTPGGWRSRRCSPTCGAPGTPRIPLYQSRPRPMTMTPDPLAPVPMADGYFRPACWDPDGRRSILEALRDAGHRASALWRGASPDWPAHQPAPMLSGRRLIGLLPLAPPMAVYVEDRVASAPPVGPVLVLPTTLKAEQAQLLGRIAVLLATDTDDWFSAALRHVVAIAAVTAPAREVPHG